MRTLYQLRLMTLFHFRLLLRNKIAFFFNLLMPLIFLVIFGVMNLDGGSKQVKVGLLDQDGGPAAQLVSQALQSAGLYEVVTGDEVGLTRQLDKGSLRAVLVLPQGLSEQVGQGQAPGEVIIRWDPTSASSASAQAGLQYFVGQLDAVGKTAAPSMTARLEQIEVTQGLGVMDFMMPAMLVYMLLNAGIVSVAMTIADQRQRGAMRHLFSTPLTMTNWLTGRIAANLALAVVQLLLIWIVGIAVFKVQPPTQILGVMVILLLAAIAGMSIGLAIGAMTQSAQATQPIALIVSMTLTFMGNAMVPLNQAPAVMQTIMKFMPSYYMTHALQQVMMKGQALSTVLVDLGLLAATAAIFLTLAGTRLRKLFVVAQ